ncbi:MAG TPA: hypothetical protein VHO48_06895 [Anaerolineaceae bacterium]|nr:hypothetical protein [Anaerolineaceae bacterium]
MNWNAVRAEIDRGKTARANGNEGQARVSARRAAGMMLRDYLEQRGEHVAGLSAYDLIEVAHASPQFSAEVMTLLEHFMTRVEPGGHFPAEIDLLDDTQRLAHLLGFTPSPSTGNSPH